MKWIEIVSLHACDGKALKRFLNTQAKPHLEAIRSLPNCVRLTMLQQPGLESVIALLAIWNGIGPLGKSKEMLRIADHLTQFGLVDHALWTENEISPKATQLPEAETKIEQRRKTFRQKHK